MFHKTRQGELVFGLVEFCLACIFASFALNSGSLWEWALALVLLIGTGQNFVRFIGTFFHGGKR